MPQSWFKPLIGVVSKNQRSDGSKLRMDYAVGETIMVKDKGNTACVITVVKEEESSCEMRKKFGVEGMMDPDATEGATPLRSLRREPWPEEW